MPQYNLIQKGPLQERLSRGLGIQERSPAPVLESTVQAVVLLDDLTKQSPFIQPTERRASAVAIVPAIAASVPVVTLTVPVTAGTAGAGVIVVVDWISVASVSIGDVRFGITSPGPTPVPGVWWDPRVGGAPSAQAFQENELALAMTDFFRYRSGSTTTQAPVPFPTRLGAVIPPGGTLGVALDVINSAATITIVWLEYALG